MFVGMAPVRISFAGGGTDMPEYYEKYGGAVVSTNINRFTYLIVNPSHDNSFQAFSSDFGLHHKKSNYETIQLKYGTDIPLSVIQHLKYRTGGDFLICSDVPAGSGLGASSTIAVNCIKTISALKKIHLSKEKIAEMAFYIERYVLKHPIGKQDDYISSFGGFNYIQFSKDKVRVVPIKISKSSLENLEQNLLLFNMGLTRNSGKVLSKQLKHIKQNKPDTMNSLHYVRQLAEELYVSLKHSDIRRLGELLNDGWQAKKKFAKGVSNQHIDKIYESALKAGAVGGKLTGAGGGGHMLLYCEKSKRKNVIEKMQRVGLKQVPFNFHSSGQRVLNLYDYNK